MLHAVEGGHEAAVGDADGVREPSAMPTAPSSTWPPYANVLLGTDLAPTGDPESRGNRKRKQAWDPLSVLNGEDNLDPALDDNSDAIWSTRPDAAEVATEDAKEAGRCATPVEARHGNLLQNRTRTSRGAAGAVRMMAWPEVVEWLRSIDVSQAVLDNVAKDKVPGYQLVTMTLADLMEDLILSKVQAKRVLKCLRGTCARDATLFQQARPGGMGAGEAAESKRGRPTMELVASMAWHEIVEWLQGIGVEEKVLDVVAAERVSGQELVAMSLADIMEDLSATQPQATFVLQRLAAGEGSTAHDTLAIEVDTVDWTMVTLGEGAGEFYKDSPFGPMNGQVLPNLVHVESVRTLLEMWDSLGQTGGKTQSATREIRFLCASV